MGTMLIVPLIDTVGVSASFKGPWLAINHRNSGVGVDISREILTPAPPVGFFDLGSLFGQWKWPL